MSHSKRNTSLAYFTSYERSLLRSSWGSQSTRLSRDSFLPFGYCRLCLLPSRNPVACGDGSHIHNSVGKPKVHVFCRECALNDLMQQRKEIKRLEKEAERAVVDRVDEKEREAEEARKKDLEGFEKGMYGLSEASSGELSRGKRKREAGEMHGRDVSSNDSKKSKSASNGTGESSFWIPSVSSLKADSNGATSGKTKLKLHPLCPASIPEEKHNYSLKSLVNVNFAEEDDNKLGNNKKERSIICPSCKRVLSNSSSPMLGTAENCGHVVCGACVKRFSDGNDSEQMRCFVCEADLDQPPKNHDNEKKKTSEVVGYLVEISCEGTGFAGRGTSLAKREGVAFQC